MTRDHIGRSLRRLEDQRFLTGQGRYVDDLAVPGQLHGVVLRSPPGHAVIENIDAAAARALPGVHAVFTAADLDTDGIGPLPCIAQVATVEPMIVPARPGMVVATLGGADELLAAFGDPSDRSAQPPRRPQHQHPFGIKEVFDAEPAPDIGGAHGNALGRDVEYRFC